MANEKETEKKSFSDILGTFLTKYGKIFLGIIIVLILVAAAFGIIGALSKANAQKGYTALDEITYSFKTARDTLEGEELTVKENESLEKALALAEKNKSNGVGARAYMFAADLDFQKNNWDAAKKSYIAAAEANKKAYTAALSYYNAAICCEELDDLEGAAKFFKTVTSYKDFPLVNRAKFSLGRVNESLEKYADALSAYESLVDKDADDSYAKLAKSRILALKAEGKSE